MCLGIPGQVVELVSPADGLAKVDFSGVRRAVNVLLLEDDLEPGDWVLVHVGFALARIDEEEARSTLELLHRLGQAEEELAQLREGAE